MNWDPVQLEREKPVIAAFEAAHPGVKVETLGMPPQDYWPRLSALAASGDLPDVMMMSSGYIQQWADAGNLADLTSLSKDIDFSAYTKSAVDTARINNGLYAIPLSWSGPVLFYNKDAFDAAGLSYPSSDWTWDKFLAAAKKLTVKKNADGAPSQWGYSVFGRYAEVDGWVYRNGGRYLNSDSTALEPNPAAIHALKYLTDLVVKEKVAPTPKDMQGVRYQDIFPLGMSAMWIDGSWNINGVRTVVGNKFKWGIAEVPKGPDATPETVRAYAWPDMLSVSMTSKQKELALAFIRQMTEARSPNDFLGGTVPAYKPIAARQEWLERDKQPDNKDVILKIGEQQLYTGFSKNWDAWRGYGASGSAGMNGELDEVFNGRKSLDEAVKSFVAYANDILNR
ncbi:sugar ABC transporter substrate-binding protein [Rhizobium rhizogenes]|uniref:ABC transporter substrate-binding protein n=1 Tax=Rhizobium rhizogenes TaxID=359 RepID=UPI0022B60245|nr:sugar ABC transporter substrate-binding protein [Rhizobium rhizogenes]MCZ7448283.1 sugar ABC transporter substrate-binding protein [Rhizobium rhizogenes]MCZ7465716.1 sugar ABC transporter substrate-binding protein [Rhizobium rhizogenes]